MSGDTGGGADSPSLSGQIKAMVASLRLRGQDEDAVWAIAGLVARTGARELELGADGRYWWASAHFRGARVMVQRKDTAAQAADALARELLDGGTCLGCGKISMIGNEAGYRLATQELADRAQREGLCRWGRIATGRVWVRECGEGAPPDSARERLAQALIELRIIPAGQIRAARRGRYDDYLSDLEMPQLTLLMELQPHGNIAQPLIRRVMDGEFDGSQHEAQAWADSPQGREVLGEFFGQHARPDPAKGSSQQARARRGGGSGKQRRSRRRK